MDTGRLWGDLNIPLNLSSRIGDDCGDDEEQIREQHIHYYITCSPYALLGWSHIAGELHYMEEETAERAAKDYVQSSPGTCGCGMCMYWTVEDAYDHVYMTQQIHACSDVHCVCSVHLLITLMLTLTTSVHMPTSTLIRTIACVGQLEYSHGKCQ